MRSVSNVRDGKCLVVITMNPRIYSRQPHVDFSKVCIFFEALLPEFLGVLNRLSLVRSEAGLRGIIDGIKLRSVKIHWHDSVHSSIRTRLLAGKLCGLHAQT